MNQDLDYKNEDVHFSSAFDICQSPLRIFCLFHWLACAGPQFLVCMYQVLTQTEVMAR